MSGERGGRRPGGRRGGGAGGPARGGGGGVLGADRRGAAGGGWWVRARPPGGAEGAVLGSGQYSGTCVEGDLDETGATPGFTRATADKVLEGRRGSGTQLTGWRAGRAH